MKKVRKIHNLVIAMAAALILGIGMLSSFTLARAYETTYTVRILPGSQSTMAPIVYSNMAYGSTITFSVKSVPLIDSSKYYVKGLKDSGMDNDHYTSDFKDNQYLRTDGAGNWFITVTEDQDFVVSYGLLGNSVAYTVNYVDEEGNELVPSNTHYGNIGDSPVLSYIYIAGYQPHTESMSVVLSADPSQNVFNFVYSEIVVEEPTQPAGGGGTTPTVVTGGGGVPTVPTVIGGGGGAVTTTTTADNTGTGDAADDGPTIAGNAPAVPTPDGANADNPDGTGADGTNPDGTTPDDGEGLVDLEDGTVPLASGAASNPSRTYDGFKVAGAKNDGNTPDEDGLFELDENGVPLASGIGSGQGSKVDHPDRLRNTIYCLDGTPFFTFRYKAIPRHQGMTAFPGKYAEYLK